jgi:hypothetical protein
MHILNLVVKHSLPCKKKKKKKTPNSRREDKITIKVQNTMIEENYRA